MNHVVTITVGGKTIGGWTDYEIESSLVEPADAFRMSRPFDVEAWGLCETSAEVVIAIDGVIILSGFVDKRRWSSDGSMYIEGRDRLGWLVQDSAPDVAYGGQLMLDVVKRLASPMFTSVTASDARNRRVRRGRGSKAAAGSEPTIANSVLPNGHIDPGRTRFAVLEELLSVDGLLMWSAGDGRELVVGKPNHDQEVQYVIRRSSDERSTCISIDYEEDIGDRYSRIVVSGSGAGNDANYATNVIGWRGEWREGPAADGTGISFARAKTLVLVEQSVRDGRTATKIAQREAARRNFHARAVNATMPGHGQVVGSGAVTLFAPNTIALVAIDDLAVRDRWLVYACTYAGNRRTGSTTALKLVPRGTEIYP